jgi:hypothetical protein
VATRAASGAGQTRRAAKQPVLLTQAHRGICRFDELVVPGTQIAMSSVKDAAIPGPVTDIPITHRLGADSVHHCLLPRPRVDDLQYRQP